MHKCKDTNVRQHGYGDFGKSIFCLRKVNKMQLHFASAIVLCIINTMIIYPNSTLALESEATTILIISHYTNASEIIDDDLKITSR
jgi:hypothetical protein